MANTLNYQADENEAGVRLANYSYDTNYQAYKYENIAASKLGTADAYKWGFFQVVADGQLFPQGVIILGDTRTTNLRLANISTRANVSTGDSVMIAGFIVAGPGSKRLLLRVLGPTLANPPSSLSGVLANPTMSLIDGYGNTLQTNDNWADTQAAAITASGYAPTNANESAMIVTLAAGNYTVIVSGVSSTTGIALVELYDLDP